MSNESQNYHRAREQQCRELAERATDPDVRRRHQELADLHASKAARFAPPSGDMGASLSAI